MINSTKVVLITGSENRHLHFIQLFQLSKKLEIVSVYAEGIEKSLENISKDLHGENEVIRRYLADRALEEKRVFPSSNFSPDVNLIPKGNINLPEVQEAIIRLNPDLIVCYGCSILREPLLSVFRGKILNIHLGLSPYYRGSGTNYWPLVNNEPEYVGTTFMHLDAGVDTGEIIHQIRAEIFPGDNSHTIGNRLIKRSLEIYRLLAENFKDLPPSHHQKANYSEKFYRKRDFSPESVQKLHVNLNSGMIENYLAQKAARDKVIPLIENELVQKLLHESSDVSLC